MHCSAGSQMFQCRSTLRFFHGQYTLPCSKTLSSSKRQFPIRTCPRKRRLTGKRSFSMPDLDGRHPNPLFSPQPICHTALATPHLPPCASSVGTRGTGTRSVAANRSAAATCSSPPTAGLVCATTCSISPPTARIIYTSFAAM